MTTHEQEIHSTRVGGFGGSDAKLFWKIGQKGLKALTNTDKKRIRVAKGIDEYKPINQTPAMKKGHDFEEWYAKQPFAPIAEREVKLQADLALNFDTFAHADFADQQQKEVWELKCVQIPEHGIEEIADDYWEQLQWYYMLGTKDVWLVVCDSSFRDFADGVHWPKHVMRDQQYIDTMLHGVKLLDENWHELDLELSDDLDVCDLLPYEAVQVAYVTDYLKQIKSLEAKADEAKQELLNFMESENIKSIKSDNYSIVYVPAGETRKFDKKKLEKAHPEIKLSDFESISERKAYVTVKLK